MQKRKSTAAYILLAVFLENIIMLTCCYCFFSGRMNKLTESEAVSVLDEALHTDGLSYILNGEQDFMGEAAFNIRAYYDEGDHITTKGFYLVLKDSCEVYMSNMLGEGYVRIT